jgi:hypothetical protein
VKLLLLKLWAITTTAKEAKAGTIPAVLLICEGTDMGILFRIHFSFGPLHLAAAQNPIKNVPLKYGVIVQNSGLPPMLILLTFTCSYLMMKFILSVITAHT